MKVVLIEDDQLQAGWTRDALSDAFEDLEIRHFATSSGFVAALPELAVSGFDVLISDMLVRWTTLDSDSTRAPDGWRYFEAGVQHVNAMRQTEGLRNVPAILWTVMSSSAISNDHIPPLTIFLTKNDDVRQLIRAIRSLMIVTGKTAKAKRTFWKDIGDSAQLKPGFAGMSVDLKKLWNTLWGSRDEP